jgi:hypothetical protein
VQVSTYQAASGAGAAAMEELKQQTRDVLDGKPAQPKIFPTQVRGGLLPARTCALPACGLICSGPAAAAGNRPPPNLGRRAVPPALCGRCLGMCGDGRMLRMPPFCQAPAYLLMAPHTAGCLPKEAASHCILPPHVFLSKQQQPASVTSSGCNRPEASPPTPRPHTLRTHPRALPPRHPPAQYAFNLFSHNSKMDVELGYNEEEVKMVKETKKIWRNNDVR